MRIFRNFNYFCFVFNFHLYRILQQWHWFTSVPFFIHREKLLKNKSFELYDCFVLRKVCCSKISLVIIPVLHQFFLLGTNVEFFRNVCDLQLLSFRYHFHWNMSLVSSNSKVEKSPWRYKRLGYFKYY